IGKIRAVAQQPPSLGLLPEWIDRRNHKARCQNRQLNTSSEENRAGRDQESLHALLIGDARKDRADIAASSCTQNFERPPYCRNSSLRVFNNCVLVGIAEYAKMRRVR